MREIIESSCGFSGLWYVAARELEPEFVGGRWQYRMVRVADRDHAVAIRLALTIPANPPREDHGWEPPGPWTYGCDY